MRSPTTTWCLPAQPITDDEHRRLAEVWGDPQLHPVGLDG